MPGRQPAAAHHQIAAVFKPPSLIGREAQDTLAP
jgi:hypothetical protein